MVDLIPNGRNVMVTDDNKVEYVQRITHHRMTNSIRGQIEAFLEGQFFALFFHFFFFSAFGSKKFKANISEGRAERRIESPSVFSFLLCYPGCYSSCVEDTYRKVGDWLPV